MVLPPAQTLPICNYDLQIVHTCFHFRSGSSIASLDEGGSLLPIEIKAGRTIAQDYFKGADYFSSLAAGRATKPRIVYGGDKDQERSNAQVLSWRNLDKLK